VFNVEKKQQRFIPLTGGTVPTSISAPVVPLTPGGGASTGNVAGSSAAAAAALAAANNGADSKDAKDGAFIAGSGDISAICLSSPTIKHANGTTVHAKVLHYHSHMTPSSECQSINTEWWLNK
jgi:hypothetical protein